MMIRWTQIRFIVLGLLAIGALIVALNELGVVRSLETNVLGPYASEWNATDMAVYLDAPFPPDAVDVHYSSFRGRGSFKLSFKAPPESASAFAQGICNGVLFQGYDPSNASNGREPNSPSALLIQADSEHYYFSASPSTPTTVFGNRCLEVSGRVNDISVDKTDPRLYTVSIHSANACNDPADSSPCFGNYITPLGYGSLPVNGPPQLIEPSPGEQSGWQLRVREGRRYDAIITLLRPDWKAQNGNMLHVQTKPQGVGEYCEGCQVDVHGPVTSFGLKVSFVGSITGTSSLSIFWHGDPGLCSIQIRDANN